MRRRLGRWSTAGLVSLLVLASVAPAAGQSPADGVAPLTLAAALERLQDHLAGSIEAMTRVAPQPPEASGEPAVVVRRGRLSSGAVALTFDDGYNSAACARIARTLRRHDAVGTFFINGIHLEREPAKWRRILEGMPVANHTRSHPRLTLVPHAVVRRQITQNEAIHERVLGRPMLKILRPPYGAYGERIGRIAGQLGYEQIAMWSIETQDWRSDVSTGDIVRRATGARPGAVILMHCSRDATARAIPRIIRHYRRRGIELAALDEVLRDAKPVDGRAKPKGCGKP